MCAKHDSLVYVTRVMWHDSHVCVPYHKHVLGVMCLMYVCNMQHTCDMTCLTCDACNVLGRRAKGVAVTPLLWLTWPMLMSNTTHSHAWHDSERGARVSVYLCLCDCVSWHEGGEVIHCNTLQHTATHCVTGWAGTRVVKRYHKLSFRFHVIQISSTFHEIYYLVGRWQGQSHELCPLHVTNSIIHLPTTMTSQRHD